MRLAALLACTVCLMNVISPAVAADIAWKRIKLDDVFRSEGVAAADVNKDGKMDVIQGEAWYEAPDWVMHPVRALNDFGDGSHSYSHSFVNCAYDFNGDGWTDLLCVDFPGAPCYWLENPKNEPGHWKQHEIWHSACNESPQFLDVTGDGKPELVIGSQPEGAIGYLEIPAGDQVYSKWRFVAVSEEKLPQWANKFYHGLGVGDVNKDGRNDILIPHGWWERPAQAKPGPWEFHAWNLKVEGPAGKFDTPPVSDVHLDDLDLDGDQDVLMCSAHQVGIWWFENVGGNQAPEYKSHQISDIVTQTHASQMADINGDGTKNLVTGKRWWAHGPDKDARPGDDPVVVWFEIQKTRGASPRFIPHVIAESSGTGVGTQFQVVDFDGDKRLDIVVSNKKGTNVLLQKNAGVAGK